MGWARTVTVAAAMALVAAACGGGSESTEPDPTATGEPEPTAEEPTAGAPPDVEIEEIDLAALTSPVALTAADQIVADLGDGALDAVVAAIGAGYSFPQIIGAIGAGRLMADGSIEGVEPDGEASTSLTLASYSSDRAPRAVLAAWNAAFQADSDTLRDAMLEIGREIDPDNPAKGALFFILLMQGVGYGPAQIADILLAPDLFVLGDFTITIEGLPAQTCSLLVDSTTGAVILPEGKPGDEECRRVVGQLAAGEESGPVFLDGALTSGTIIDGETIVEVLRNELSLALLPDGTVEGGGTVSRRAAPEGDDCEDLKISPLGFTFTGAFVDEERTQVEGTFTYRVKAEEFVNEGTCDAPLRFGTGGGTWTGEWSPEEGLLVGELTVSSGTFGTNPFELSAASG